MIFINPAMPSVSHLIVEYLLDTFCDTLRTLHCQHNNILSKNWMKMMDVVKNGYKLKVIIVHCKLMHFNCKMHQNPSPISLMYIELNLTQSSSTSYCRYNHAFETQLEVIWSICKLQMRQIFVFLMNTVCVTLNFFF